MTVLHSRPTDHTPPPSITSVISSLHYPVGFQNANVNFIHIIIEQMWR